MANMLEENLDFNNVQMVRDFIHDNESSLYGGKDVEGRPVAILLNQGEGMTVKYFQSNGWVCVHDYDSDGILEMETFERPIERNTFSYV